MTTAGTRSAGLAAMTERPIRPSREDGRNGPEGRNVTLPASFPEVAGTVGTVGKFNDFNNSHFLVRTKSDPLEVIEFIGLFALPALPSLER